MSTKSDRFFKTPSSFFAAQRKRIALKLKVGLASLKTVIMEIDFHYLKIMDNILEHMATIPDEVPLSPDLIAKRAGIEIEKTLIFLMCAKMSRDGYLQRYDGVKYTLYAEGFFFIKTGGYSTEEIRNRKKANLQSWQTWAIVIGTFLAGVYGLVEILKRLLQC